MGKKIPSSACGDKSSWDTEVALRLTECLRLYWASLFYQVKNFSAENAEKKTEDAENAMVAL
jgi:hypothetical protein